MIGLAIPFIIEGLGAWLGYKANKSAGNAATEWARGERDIAIFNSKVANLRAADAEARGRWEATTIKQGAEGLIGTAIAGFASQNVDVGIGSPVDVGADIAYLGEIDAQMALTNAAREAWGYRVDAMNFQQQAAQALKKGAQEKSASNYAAAGSILGGASAATSLLARRYGWGAPKPKPVG